MSGSGWAGPSPPRWPRRWALVLDSARWLVSDITDRYRIYFADLLDRESTRAGGGPVPLQRMLTMASPYLYTHGRGVGELASPSVAELQRRWETGARATLVSQQASGQRGRDQRQGRRVLPGAPGRLERRPAALTGQS